MSEYYIPQFKLSVRKPGPGPSHENSHSGLVLYALAAAYAQAAYRDQAVTTLTFAYRAAPPLTLSETDLLNLTQYTDELTWIGQHMPSLTPTLQLLSRFMDLGYARP